MELCVDPRVHGSWCLEREKEGVLLLLFGWLVGCLFVCLFVYLFVVYLFVVCLLFVYLFVVYLFVCLFVMFVVVY